MAGNLSARDLLVVRSAPGAHRVALRAGISVLVPLLAVLSLGHPEWSAYAAFGAFASLYGRNHVHLPRAVMQASAGTALTASVVAGVLVGCLPQRAWVSVLVAAAVSFGGSLLARAQDWHPPGPLFLLFGFGAVSSVPHVPADAPVAIAVAGLSAAFAVVVGNAGSVLRGQRSAPGRLRPAWSRDAVRAAVAVLIAGSITTAVGIGHPYWAMVAAVAPLSAPGAGSQLLRAGHRVVGTLLGLGSAALLLALAPSPMGIVVLIGGLQIVTELLIGRNYALALLFITPMALLMGEIALPRPMGGLLFDRGVETAIGAAVAALLIGAEVLLRRAAAHRSGTAGG